MCQQNQTPAGVLLRIPLKQDTAPKRIPLKQHTAPKSVQHTAPRQSVHSRTRPGGPSVMRCQRPPTASHARVCGAPQVWSARHGAPVH
eukprot:366034-Chlamydomonas_euryale.AAC.2